MSARAIYLPVDAIHSDSHIAPGDSFFAKTRGYPYQFSSEVQNFTHLTHAFYLVDFPELSFDTFEIPVHRSSLRNRLGVAQVAH